MSSQGRPAARRPPSDRRYGYNRRARSHLARSDRFRFRCRSRSMHERRRIVGTERALTVYRLAR
eukprot:459513-Prorocentrum_minimum.AAC.1